MNWLDIVIIVALVLAVLGGLKNGLIKGVITLAGMIGGIILAGRYYETLGSLLPESWGGGANIAGFVIILVLVLVVAAIVAFLLRNLLKAIMLCNQKNIISGAGQTRGFLIEDPRIQHMVHRR